MNCPSCHNDVDVLERNYGALFTCPKCQAVYFVNFEGVAEYSDIPLEMPTENADCLPIEKSLEFASAEVPTADPFQQSEMESAAAAYELAMAPVENADLPSEPSSNFSSIAQEISDFGNSEVQIAALNYDLKVSGLDSKEEIKAFQEAIQDSRFGWDAAELTKKVKNGIIKFDKLNPVQAYVLAKRLQFLGLETEWSQHVLE